MASVKFKFLKNVTVDILDGVQFHIPARQVMHVTAEGYEVARLAFDMDKVHEVPLEDISAEMPEKGDYPDEFYNSVILAEFYTETKERRAKNKVVLDRLKSLEKSGTIKLVDNEPKASEKPKAPRVRNAPSEE
jgi:hypothetical protein